jgi:hypothetical protein
MTSDEMGDSQALSDRLMRGFRAIGTSDARQSGLSAGQTFEYLGLLGFIWETAIR